MEMNTMTTPKTAALYALISTTDKGQDPELQLGELREYATRQGWVVEGEYVDRGISGAKESRPELNRLMADAKAGRFQVVLVWKFDRFARSVIYLHKAINSLREMGVEFVSKTEQVDTTTPMGKMIFTVVGAMAEMERELIAERVKAGMKNAKAKGVKMGAPVALDSVAADRLIATGMSTQNIARELNVSERTVYRFRALAAA